MKKTSYVFLLLAVALLFASIAQADTVDPAIGIKGGGGSTGLFSANDPNFAFTVLGSNFTIGSEQSFFFLNASGQTATEVFLAATLLQGTPTLTFTCVASIAYFNSCSQQDQGGGTILIRYFNSAEGSLGGIPNDPNPNCDGPQSCSPSAGNSAADFAVFVRDVGWDLAGLPNGQGFSVQGSFVNPVPEPGSMVLLGSGLAAIGLRRFRRNRNKEA
jgi:hypothetical protein